MRCCRTTLCRMNPFLLALAFVFFQSTSATQPVAAIQKETQAEKQSNFQQQALGGLFHRWTFDESKSEEALQEFSPFVVGADSPAVWTIGTDAEAPSPPR